MKIVWPNQLDTFNLPRTLEEKNAADPGVHFANEDVSYLLQLIEQKIGIKGTASELSIFARIEALESAPTVSETEAASTSGITSLNGLSDSSQTFANANDTNVTLTITSTTGVHTFTLGWTGTLAAGRLNSNVVQSVINDTNIGGSISAQALTLSWLGTLSAARLNSNVVQSVVNDTNVTGSISSQALTLAWTGVLSFSRGGTGLSSLSQGDTLYASATNTLATLAKQTAATLYISNTGTSNNPAWARVNLANGVTGTLPTGNGGTGSSSYTSGNGLGAVIFWGTSTSFDSRTALAFDGSGILYVNSPAGVGSTGDWSPGQVPNTRISVSSSTLAAARLQVSSNTASSCFELYFVKTGGTMSSILPVQSSSDTLANITGYGNVVITGINTFSPVARIQFNMDGSPTSTSMPGNIRFLTTPSGSLTLTEVFRIDNGGQIYGTAGTTSMTKGFIHIPSAAGAPSGTPSNPSGRVPLYYDSTNDKLYVYNGAWKSVALI